MSQIQSELSIKTDKLETQQASYQQLADKYLKLKAQTSEEEEVHIATYMLICHFVLTCVTIRLFIHHCTYENNLLLCPMGAYVQCIYYLNQNTPGVKK